MAHLDEAIRGYIAGPLGGRIGGDPVRVIGFDLLQFVGQTIEFEVADQCGIQHVIPVIMEMNDPFQLFVSGFRVHPAIIAFGR